MITREDLVRELARACREETAASVTFDSTRTPRARAARLKAEKDLLAFGKGVARKRGEEEIASGATIGNRKKRAFHYIAFLKGESPTRFYVGNEPIASAAAAAFSGWSKADTVLWPTDEAGVYTAKWFDPYSDMFRETRFVIIEELRAVR